MSDLLNTLRDALEICLNPCELVQVDQIPEFKQAAELLSTPDALLWRLLEERAGEVVEVEPCEETLTRTDHLGVPLYDWEQEDLMIDGYEYAAIVRYLDAEPDEDGVRVSTPAMEHCDLKEVWEHILCLVRGARAIAAQEERGRE